MFEEPNQEPIKHHVTPLGSNIIDVHGYDFPINEPIYSPRYTSSHLGANEIFLQDLIGYTKVFLQSRHLCGEGMAKVYSRNPRGKLPACPICVLPRDGHKISPDCQWFYWV